MTKISKSAKIVFTNCGFTSSIKTDGRVARLDLNSTSVTVDGDEPVVVCTQELGVFSQILSKVTKACSVRGAKKTPPDYSSVDISIVDGKSILVKTSKFKMSFGLVKEAAITTLKHHDRNWTQIAEVNVLVDDINDVLSSTFTFRDSKNLLVGITHQDDMVRNFAYAQIFDPNDPTSNVSVSKFGNIVSGDLTRKVTLDIPRLQTIAAFPVESMMFVFNQQPVAYSDFEVLGRSDNGGYSTKYTLMFEYMSDAAINPQTDASKV